MARIRVGVVDDHAIVREGIRALLSGEPDIEVVGEAADGTSAIALAERVRPDVLLMDIAMPGLGGLEAAAEIHRAQPEVRILVLSQYDNAEYVRRFLRLGAAGYVLKRAAGSELVAAIHAVSRGGLVIDPAVAREAFGEAAGSGPQPADPYEALTDREKQVLKLVAEGRSNKEVADILDISVKTAMTHREHVMQKLALHSRTDLIRFALRQGIISA
ncbi:MAG: response regulator [Betaproteobacteria bacterium]